MSALFSVFLASATKAVAPHESPMNVSVVTLFYAISQFICPALARVIIGLGGGFPVAFTVSAILTVVGLELIRQTTQTPANSPK